MIIDLNLPNTLNQEKIVRLFLLILITSADVKAGQGFNQCLAYNNDGTFNPYNLLYSNLSLSNFGDNSFTNYQQLGTVCCNSSECSPYNPCPLSNVGFNLFCATINNQSTICSGSACAGFIDNMPITSNLSIGNCPVPANITAVSNYLKNISPIGINNGYATWNCPTPSPCQGLSCNWDNGCIFCFRFPSVTYNGSCYMQWPTPFPSNYLSSNSISILTTSSSSMASFSSYIITPSSKSTSPITNSSFNYYLIEEITIPIGVVGVGSISGLTYYYLCYKKKKRKKTYKVRQLNKESLIEETSVNNEEEVINNFQDLNKSIENITEAETNETFYYTTYSTRTEQIEELAKQKKDLQKKLKEMKEQLTKFTNSEKDINKQIEKKRVELENLKNKCLEKSSVFDKTELKKELEELLKAQKENNIKLKNRIEKSLLKETSLTNEELTNLCQLQEELFTLELELGTIQGNIRQTEERIIVINNYSGTFTNQEGIMLVGNQQLGDSNNFSINESKKIEWINIHPDFANQQLIQQWLNNYFTVQQTQEWINIGLTTNDSDFCAWLRNSKQLTAEQCLNYHNLVQLKTEYRNQQTQIEQPPK